MTTAPILSKVRNLDAIVDEIRAFLKVPTPTAWIEHALGDLPTLLRDHANCEYKAAATGMSLVNRYRGHGKLQRLMARLVREEMLHYEQVLMFMERMGIRYEPLSASRYARSMHALCRSEDPARLTDVLLIGAIVEARSCERFASIWPRLPTELGKYYRSLLRSEGRHYQDYLALAKMQTEEGEYHERLSVFLDKDAELISSYDPEFRFHSGVPA